MFHSMYLSFQEWLILSPLILPWTKYYIEFSKHVTSHLMPAISLYLTALQNQGLFLVKLFHWLGCSQISVLVTICNKLNFTRSSVPSFIRCLLVPPLLLNAAVIFSLLFFHLDRVFFGTSNFFETSLLESPRSIYTNAAYFTSNVCLLWRHLFPVMLVISSKSQEQLRS